MCPVERYWLCWARALLLEGSNRYTLSFCTPEITLSYGGCSQGKGYRMLRYKNTIAHSLHTAKQNAVWMYELVQKSHQVFRRIDCLYVQAVSVTGCQTPLLPLCCCPIPLHPPALPGIPKLVLPASCSRSSGWL